MCALFTIASSSIVISSQPCAAVSGGVAWQIVTGTWFGSQLGKSFFLIFPSLVLVLLLDHLAESVSVLLVGASKYSVKTLVSLLANSSPTGTSAVSLDAVISSVRFSEFVTDQSTLYL